MTTKVDLGVPSVEDKIPKTHPYWCFECGQTQWVEPGELIAIPTCTCLPCDDCQHNVEMRCCGTLVHSGKAPSNPAGNWGRAMYDLGRESAFRSLEGLIGKEKP